jgi:hypothetical protein
MVVMVVMMMTLLLLLLLLMMMMMMTMMSALPVCLASRLYKRQPLDFPGYLALSRNYFDPRWTGERRLKVSNDLVLHRNKCGILTIILRIRDDSVLHTSAGHQ